MLAVEGIHGNPLVGFQQFEHHGQVILRDRVDHRDRLQLRDHHHPCRIPCAHDVAWIDQAQAQTPRHGRRDTRIRELEPRIVDLALVYFDGAFVLVHQRFLRIHELLGDRVLRKQNFVALEVGARIREQRLVAHHHALDLRQCRLVRARVDFRQQFAFLDRLAFAKQHAHQLTVDAASHGHGPQRSDGAEPVKVNVDAARLRGYRHHRRSTPGVTAAALAGPISSAALAG